MNKCGHTFVELMIVVAIIGILASVAISVFSESKGKAERAQQSQSITIEDNNFNMICDKPVGEREADLICTARVDKKDVDYACSYYYNGDGFTINCY